MNRLCWLAFLVTNLAPRWVKAAPAGQNGPPARNLQQLEIRISWGHRSASARDFYLKLLGHDLTFESASPLQFENGDQLDGMLCRTTAGAGDVDGVGLKIAYAARQIQPVAKVQSIWRYLLDHSDPDTARRLESDPAFRPDSRQLTVQMNPEGTTGFSLTVDQLLLQRSFWIPDLDVFVSAGEPPVSYAQHMASLAEWKGQRVLDEVSRAAEATYEQFCARWEDMGSPDYRNPHSVWPGHIVCLTWDSAIPKFGIDRGANVWNDNGNPDHFYLGFDFGALTDSLEKSWKGQQLVKGLPVVNSTFEEHGPRLEAEQFAYPLNGPPPERRGNTPMVLLEKVRVTDLSGQPRQAVLKLVYRREVPAENIRVERNGGGWTWQDAARQATWLTLQGSGITLETNSVQAGRWTTNSASLLLALPANGSRELVLKLPSAPVAAKDTGTLAGIDYAAARAQTEAFWTHYLARGAQFSVPEESVNTLFRANLWHALRLPRRHGGPGPDVKLDLPYSNFAYDQRGTPWPVNQAVYVDYMLYDLRGYHSISEEELTAIYRNNQDANGHVGGFANWGVYTPSMMYTVAKHYLLSGDRGSFERLLSPTLKALDWCLAELKAAQDRSDHAAGLVLAPLNDLSHEPEAWAFNQAYLYAGVQVLGQALAEFGHPRAAECLAAARALRQAIQAGFGHASMLSPLVQLRDHTWVPYVPVDALTPGRRLDIWYPTDVDCGALHLCRLKALDPEGVPALCLLLDHEDNLFLNHWGMANEPVYNQQATTYLLRDEPKAAIRAFYSMMACAFSHSVFEPVEHRWAWGQYFGPPSTDGAWFELYRQMLVRELDDGSLLLCQATPRKWLEQGKRIVVERAPTYFGDLDFTIESRAAEGEIRAMITPPQRKRPSLLLVRLRHPEGKRMRSVTVNGKNWTDFDVRKEWVRIPRPAEQTCTVVAEY